MDRTFASVCFLLLLASPAHADGPYFARGAYFAGAGEPWSAEAGNQLHDDGLHGDGAAGDGIYGAYVVADQGQGIYGFKIANMDWTENYPNQPQYPLSNARVYIEGPGDIIHFRLDTNTNVDGWIPAANAVVTDQPAPAGFDYEVIGSAPETGSWNFGVPAPLVGTHLVAQTVIATPGVYEFKFRVVGTWDICNYGARYNMLISDNFTYTTSKPNSEVRFEFDLETGRGRAAEFDSTPARSTTWGRLKQIYR